MKRRQQPRAKKAECPLWMMTFGDCMSLLVTFFVMLIAFSNLEEEKLTEMLGAMRGALGAVDRPKAEIYPDFSVQSEQLQTEFGEEMEHRFLTREEISSLMPRFQDEVRTRFPDSDFLVPDRIIIRMLDEGMAVLLHSTELFAEGSAQWVNDYSALWEGFSMLLRGRANEIRITALISSDTRIYSETAHTAWGLGVERAEAVAEALQGTMKVPASRFGAGVQLFPAPPSVAQANQMEIMIMSQETAQMAETEKLGQNGVRP